MRLVSEDTERAAWARYDEVVAPFKRDYDDAIREAGRIFRQRTAAAWAELMQELGLFRGTSWLRRHLPPPAGARP